MLTILQPGSQTVGGFNVQVIVKVKNFGTTTITSMDIAYQVGVSSPVSVPWTGTLLPDSTLDYTFTTTYVSPDSLYDLCAYTVVTGDIYPSNDGTCKSVQGTVGVKEDYLSGLILNQNFPNPANGLTTIDFTVPENGEIVISLMNSFDPIMQSIFIIMELDSGFPSQKRLQQFIIQIFRSKVCLTRVPAFQ